MDFRLDARDESKQLTHPEPSLANRTIDISSANATANRQGHCGLVNLDRLKVAEVDSETLLEPLKSIHNRMTATRC